MDPEIETEEKETVYYQTRVPKIRTKDLLDKQALILSWRLF
jgi:hypothetical protein